MSEFTKGPWVVNKTGIHWNNPSLCNIEIAFGEIGECICDTVYEEADANLVALISAAPDMYEALSEALSMIERQPDFNDDGDGLLISRCSQALAKARGEL